MKLHSPLLKIIKHQCSNFSWNQNFFRWNSSHKKAIPIPHAATLESKEILIISDFLSALENMLTPKMKSSIMLCYFYTYVMLLIDILLFVYIQVYTYTSGLPVLVYLLYLNIGHYCRRSNYDTLQYILFTLDHTKLKVMIIFYYKQICHTQIWWISIKTLCRRVTLVKGSVS